MNAVSSSSIFLQYVLHVSLEHMLLPHIIAWYSNNNDLDANLIEQRLRACTNLKSFNK